MPKIWQYNRNTKCIGKKGVCVYVSVTLQNGFTHYKCPKNTYKIIIKIISCCYILRMLIQDVDNQSKLQIFLLEMEQCNKQRKHRWWVDDININRLQQFFSGFPHQFFTNLPYQSLHGAIQFATSTSICSHWTNHTLA